MLVLFRISRLDFSNHVKLLPIHLYIPSSGILLESPQFRCDIRQDLVKYCGLAGTLPTFQILAEHCLHLQLLRIVAKVRFI